jgi:hypothetical protein
MQVLDDHQAVEFNMTELTGIMLLGVVMEGALNPWWSNVIKERVKAAHDVSLPRVQVRVESNFVAKSRSDLQHSCVKGLQGVSNRGSSWSLSCPCVDMHVWTLAKRA